MSYPIPSLEQVRAAILADWRNQDNLITITADSDNYIRASGIASAILGLYQFTSWGINQYFPDTADLESLVRFASARGIIQKAASSATGSINFTGTAAAAIPIGTIVQTADGKQYQTSIAGVISALGTAAIPAIAVTLGPDGNQANNTPGTLQVAPLNIDAAVVLTSMSGGIDAESVQSLLSRVLDRLRQPPAGGNKFDYVRWALEVPGVTSAYCYPLRRGIGSVDVAILSNGVPPTLALRTAVAAYIDDRKPPETDCMILSPQQITCAVSATIVLSAGVNLASVQAAALLALTAYFSTLNPGSTAVRSRIQSIIQEVAGVVDVTLTAPAINLATLVDATHIELPTLGVVTIGL